MKDNTKTIKLQAKRSQHREHSTPIYLTSSFVYDSAEHAEAMFKGEEKGDIYSRFTNPNTTELINKFCQLEDAEHGVTTASGMAAIFNTLAAHLKKGDHLVACSSLFGNSIYIIQHILPSWGIEYTLVDVMDQEGWVSSFNERTKMVLIETPTNPGLELIDIEWLSILCKKNRAIFCVDNCFATPILQKPMHLGADIVIHSATKWTDGQGRVLGGLALGHNDMIQPIYDFIRRTGACLSPFNAWILSKSLETLELRMERHCANALKLAEWFSTHDKVKRTHYPFLESHAQFELAKSQMTHGGGIVTIDLDGTKDQIFKFINNLTIPNITANLGDSRTIVTHPATTTHSKMSQKERENVGINITTLRISVGLESIDDIIPDMDQALRSI